MEIGICGALTLIFVVLKLVGVIAWSWIWVLSPIWIGIIIGIVIIVLSTWISYRWEQKIKKDLGIK